MKEKQQIMKYYIKKTMIKLEKMYHVHFKWKQIYFQPSVVFMKNHLLNKNFNICT